MIHRFHDFELDEDAREMRLNGRVLSLQPRVLDLLFLLWQERDRVVSKEEILQSLWPDDVVSEGSVQRVVSLARAALREGDAAKLIRTYHRVGYRLCVDAAEAHDWQAASANLAKLDADRGLTADELEKCAEFDMWNGEPGDAITHLERAVAAHAAAGNPKGAGRAAVTLARIMGEQDETAVAKGWHARAKRYLEGLTPCHELGLWEWMASRLAFIEGDLEETERRALRAEEIGRSVSDCDVESLALLYRGHALLARGTLAEGIRLQDEAAALCMSGQVSNWSATAVYCGVIWSCCNRADWGRAAQWTEQFSRLCNQQGMLTYPGTCILYRAEVLHVGGQLVEAEREITRASEVLAAVAPWAEGNAHRVRGELHLARGEIDAAEKAFRRAYELGWNPQPGLALVQLAQGKVDSAIAGLERALAEPDWTSQQRRILILCHLVVVRVQAGQLDEARPALQELDGLGGMSDIPALMASIERARGEMALAEERIEDAILHFRRSLQRWREVKSSPHEATVRLRLASALQRTNDPEGAAMEITTAEIIYRSLGAKALVENCVRLRGALDRGTA